MGGGRKGSMQCAEGYVERRVMGQGEWLCSLTVDLLQMFCIRIPMLGVGHGRLFIYFLMAIS